MPSESQPTALRGRQLSLLPAAVGLLYMIALVRTAWLGDDAFIMLRAVDNLVHGYGLVSNPPERVLAFTNPLWALTMSIPCALGLSAYAAAIGTGLAASTAALVWIVSRAAPDRLSGALAALWLATSGAYVEFSSGGLENPLAHLLLAIFFTAFVTGRLAPARARTWVLAALIVVNRQDHGLLIAPALLALLFKPERSGAERSIFLRVRPKLVRPVRPVARAIALGALPLFAWLSFAIVYYGFPVPNTAYAKLNTLLPVSILVTQGAVYVMDDLQRDPMTLLVIALGVFGCLRERSGAGLAIAAGVALYLAYVVRIGGDFMAGRFLTAPFMVCVVWLAARGLPRTPELEVAAVAVASVTLALLFPASLRPNDKWECAIGVSGIVDERQCYGEFTGLPENVATQKYMSHGRFKRGLELRRGAPKVLVSTNVGIMGFAAGPKVHIIDAMALTDPLLARIPYGADLDFRIGHFQRKVPAGYEKSIRRGRNLIKDPCLHAYYDVLSSVIRGPLFTRERWKAIWGLNVGRYDYLMKQPCVLPAKAPTSG